MLDRVATYKEKTEALKAKIRKAMTYPIAVIIVAIVVTGVLLVKVVPTFAETFKGFGADLPAFTLFVLGISEFVQQWWLFIAVALVLAIWGYFQAISSLIEFSRPGRLDSTETSHHWYDCS
jgi:type IV pilus assembly protein PilC